MFLSRPSREINNNVSHLGITLNNASIFKITIIFETQNIIVVDIYGFIYLCSNNILFIKSIEMYSCILLPFSRQISIYIRLIEFRCSEARGLVAGFRTQPKTKQTQQQRIPASTDDGF